MPSETVKMPASASPRSNRGMVELAEEVLAMKGQVQELKEKISRDEDQLKHEIVNSGDLSYLTINYRAFRRSHRRR